MFVYLKYITGENKLVAYFLARLRDKKTIIFNFYVALNNKTAQFQAMACDHVCSKVLFRLLCNSLF